jgi:hypothetical protein
MSPEAVALFKPVDDESVLQAIDNQILSLEEANKSEFGYIGLVKNIKRNQFKRCIWISSIGHSSEVYVFYPSIDPCKREYEPMDMEKML